MAKLSIMAMYEYSPWIFDSFNLPASVEQKTLLDLIFSETAELEVLYPQPDIFNRILGSWSKSKLESWNRIEKALSAEYSPIDNYNREETHIDSYNRNLSETGTSKSNSSGTELNKRAAFNSAEQVESDSSEDISESNIQNSTKLGGSDSRNINIKAHGNIGITTTQKMITEEIKMRVKYNLYEIICNDFIDKFCLGVY